MGGLFMYEIRKIQSALKMTIGGKKSNKTIREPTRNVDLSQQTVTTYCTHVFLGHLQRIRKKVFVVAPLTD